MLKYHLKANYLTFGEKNDFTSGPWTIEEGKKRFCCKKHNTNDLQCFIHILYFTDYILIICFGFRI